jgi:Na+/melibiose symporter-like transporter
MFFLELFFENLKFLFFLLPIFMLISFFVLKYFFKVDAIKFIRRELQKQKENTENKNDIQVIVEDKE